MKEKIKVYSALALATAAVLPLGCDKDDPATNDPNIEDKTWNRVFTAQLIAPNEYIDEDSIDINEDGTFDINIGIGKGTTPGDKYNYWALYSKSGNQVLAQTTGVYALLKTLASGTEIGSSSTTWNDSGYGAYYSQYYGVDLGDIKAGVSNKLVGFRFKIGGNTHYGWAKFSYSSDGLTVTLVETGYNTSPGESIEAEAK